MTLLLGPHSSGKTTMLLALAGKLDPTLKTSEKITYNGHEMQEFVPQRTTAYISQYDLHIGEMTVRETLAFSARVQGVGSRYEMLAELARREKDANIKLDPDVDIYMKAAATAGQEANVVIDYVLKHYLILLLVNQMASALFRMTATLGRNMTVAFSFGGFAMLIFFALGGFVLARGHIPNWWI